MRPKLLLLATFCYLAFVAKGQTAVQYDVVIDEIMADPTPQAGLPNTEFIELKNVSSKALDLSGWKLSTSSSISGSFPSYVLAPDSFLVISSTSNASVLSSFGSVLGIPSFPSLPNDGTVLSLISKEGKTIHAVSYSSAWYQNTIKSDGGWTLEMIDTHSPCMGINNWKASNDVNGGTPGKLNSVDALNIDETPPQLIRTYSIDSLTLVAVFDEPLDSASAAQASNFTLTNGFTVTSATPQAPLFDQVLIKLSTPLQKRSVYTLTVVNVMDCKGNTISAFNKVNIGWAEEAFPGDIIINEILFNPKPNAFDFVEVYSKSNKIFDASKLYIANRNTSGTISAAKKLSETPFYIFPGHYIVLTEDATSLVHEYLVQNPQNVLVVSSLPSYPDDKGTVVITNAQGDVIDEVAYSATWHFGLISDAEGVSLERVDPDIPSQDPSNWHSAASTVGYGTPTYKNSQYKMADNINATIDVSPKVFSPDNDAFDDMATINYKMEATGYVANITIFNSSGRPVRYLVKNATLGLKGSWNWDGLDEKNQKLPIGTYIIYTETFNLQGKKKHFKNTVVLARKF
ncbi:MAG: lamin tail domain-containing protein [Flavisolibacter sp.]